MRRCLQALTEETVGKGETAKFKRIKNQATLDMLRLFRLRLNWAKLSQNVKKLRAERQFQLVRDKRANERLLLLKQLNHQIEISESASIAYDRSRLDESVLDDLSELLRRNDVSQDHSSLDKSDLTFNQRCEIGDER